MSNNKSQTWTIEFILAFLIFSAAFIMSIKTIVNIYGNDDLSLVIKEAELISEQLTSEGYPSNWDNDTLIRIGLMSNGSLNPEKLNRFYNLNYNYAKSSFATQYNYFVFFSNSNGNLPLFYYANDSLTIEQGCGSGYNSIVKSYDTECKFDKSGLTYDDFVAMKRITVYNSTLVVLNIWVWK
ncbi:TPA: hypothetical protein HA235_05820 [Candidatus Woesearchaeota archaeon]|nr:hypothetical protein [Candidatus Woesearchaeota archaeon]HIH32200.1 hypothetical protein [Candidatus Woesearchaeota archaeon]HIH55587.1 hypothetical protein [Candidatus Woesearchaeota archaeon]HIJ02559.1 hypothetical protein [Candidatus Woesearchaeota archaeon]HIJ13395.1 hypothetical protein [Candidatus Woesearchaeota archaeon]